MKFKLPDSFVNQMRDILPEGELDSFVEAMISSPSLSIRKNRKKPAHLDFHSDASLVAWEPNAYYLDERPLFTVDPLFHGGCYYVQEASSMMLRLVANAYLQSESPLIGLDLCAAPGGKSTHLLDLISDDSLLVVNEIVPSRFQILNENLIRWGRHNMIRTIAPPAKLSNVGAMFDFILVDAPCSGEGMMRKDEQAITHWSPSNVFSCAIRQKEILEEAMKMLKPDGLLIYSTCTFNSEENELIGDWIIQELDCIGLPIPNAIQHGFVERKGASTQAYFAYPHRIQGEGFAIQVFRKQEEAFHQRRREHSNKLPISAIEEHGFSELFASSNSIVATELQDGYYFLEKDHVEIAAQLRSVVKGAIPGRKLGIKKGSNFVPDHELALSTAIMNSIQGHVSYSKEEAVQYLRGESPTMAVDGAKGWQLAMYKGVPLGWVKVLDQRVNNYYPASYRIRMRV